MLVIISSASLSLCFAEQNVLSVFWFHVDTVDTTAYRI